MVDVRYLALNIDFYVLHLDLYIAILFALISSLYQRFMYLVKLSVAILVVRSGGRGLGNLFTGVANHVAPSRRHDSPQP